MAKKKKNTLPSPLKLDLACGQRKKEGFFGVDIAQCDGVDMIVDLEQYPWPFEDNSVDEVYMSHYLEHVTDLMAFMNELYRIMKPGAKCVILAPYYNSMRCWQDPTHKQAISEATFLYYNLAWRKMNGLDHYPITCNFDYTYGYNMMPDWVSRSPATQQFAVRHYTNVVSDIQTTLTKVA